MSKLMGTSRRVTALICVLLAGAMLFAGCGAAEPDTAAETSQGQSGAQKQGNPNKNPNAVSASNNAATQTQGEAYDNDGEADQPGFTFVYNNVSISPDDYVRPLTKSLGSDYEYYEGPTCAYQGVEKCYQYADFEVYTYQDENEDDRVLYVNLRSDAITTPEGLRLGDTYERMIEIYGSDYVDEFSYILGDTELDIVVNNGRVEGICYVKAIK